MADHARGDLDDAVSELTAARRFVRDEHRATKRQRRGFEEFRRTVEATPPVERGAVTESAGSLSPGWTTGVSTASAATDDRCRRVRAAFEESVLPHADAETDSVYATLAAELSSEVAVALASEGGGNRFTGPLRAAVLDCVDQRLAENSVMLRALERERASLDDAVETAKEVSESLPGVGDGVLILSTDGELWDRRRRIATLEDDLDAAIRARQRTLDRVTATDVKAGIAHDTVVEYLFGDRDTTYPALDSLLRCTRECRRRRGILDSALGGE
ncbi:DUF7260 family protein [Halobellus sp. GM3]|uniref:DUF7260 family protein n=1 Tax=Halobellus sp. GM3 TaxID=3458410 RepID=UPI00403E2C53